MKNPRFLIFWTIVIPAFLGAEDSPVISPPAGSDLSQQAFQVQRLTDEVQLLRKELSLSFQTHREQLRDSKLSPVAYIQASTEFAKSKREEMERLTTKQQELSQISPEVHPPRKVIVPIAATAEETSQLESLQNEIEGKKEQIQNADREGKVLLINELVLAQRTQKQLIDSIALRSREVDSLARQSDEEVNPAILELQRELSDLLRQPTPSRERLKAIENQLRIERAAATQGAP